VKLAELEARFHALVTARQSVAATLAAPGGIAGADLDGWVVGDDSLSAIERLDVYANMYFLRIRDVLADELPRTAAVLGANAFHGLVTDYLAACPPSHPSLREVGARLPAFLADHRLGRERPWLAELARLERVRLELVDGPDAQALTVDDARAADPEWFVTAPLRLVPCHALLENKHPIAPLWRALAPSAEAGAADPPEAHTPAAGPETLLVWRCENEIRHRAVDGEEDGEELAWLRRLASGATFEALCELAPVGAAPDAVAPRAFERLGRFIADGLLRALPTES
jgi:hypothetical protein